MTSKKARSMAGLPWIAAMAFFMQALDATILNTALPAIAHSLNRSPLAMQSAIISYTLTVAMLIPVSGWLADRFGTRRVFMVAVSLFTLGSLACALSSSLSELVIFRVVQGAVKRISGGNGIDSLNAKSRNAAALAVYAGPDATAS